MVSSCLLNIHIHFRSYIVNSEYDYRSLPYISQGNFYLYYNTVGVY